MSLTDTQDEFVKKFILLTDSEDVSDLQEVLDRLARVEVPAGATEQEAKDIGAEIALARELLRDPDTPMVVDQASMATGGAERLVEQVAERIKRTGEEAGMLLKRAGGLEATLDGEAPADERETLRKKALDLAATLDGATDPVIVATAKSGVEELEKRILLVNETAERDRETRKKKAEELRAQAAKMTLPPDALEGETSTAETLVRKLADLPEIPTPEALEQAGKDIAALVETLNDLELRLKERRTRFARVAPLLERLTNDAPKLAAHPRAPANGEAAEIAQDAKKLLAQSQPLADWSKVAEWGEDSLSSLESSITELERRMDELNKAIAQKVLDVDKAIEAAMTCISTPEGRAFAKGQVTAFELLVTQQAKLAGDDLDQAETVISELGTLVGGLNRLSRALAAREARINAVVVPPDTDLSTKEKAALVAARKTALDALDKVDEL